MIRMCNFGFTDTRTSVHLGTNGNMSELSAAMGLTSLDMIDDVISWNDQIFDSYHKYFCKVPGLKLIEYNRKEKNNFQYIVFEIDESVTGISRDDIMVALHEENIMVQRYFYPGCHHMEPYRTLYENTKLQLNNSDLVAERVLLFPQGFGVTPEAVAIISDKIAQIIDKRKEVVRALESQDKKLIKFN